MKNILLTGGLGYIGSHTVVELVNASYNPIIVDNLSNSKIDVLGKLEQLVNKHLNFELVDCTKLSEMEKIFKKYNIDSIIHFAALKSVNESINKPLDYYYNNILSLVNILKCMSKFNVSNLVFSSSCTVYGEPSRLPVTEDTPVQQTSSPYGNTKKICEEILQDYAKVNTIKKIIILRYFNPIGAHPSGLIGELPNGVPQNLVPYITQTAIGKRVQLKIYGNDYPTPDGTCIRDYIDVNDLANAHVLCLKHFNKMNHNNNIQVFNIGTGKGVSVLQLVQEFERVNGLKLNYVFDKRRDGDIVQIWADASLANQVLEWKPKYCLSETLQNAWKWENNIKNEFSV